MLTVGGKGAIDGLSGIFPRTVVKLYTIFEESSARGVNKQDLEEMRKLQYKICQGERLIGKWGTVGIKEAIARVWGIGEKEGARLPLAGGFQGGDKEWENWSEVFDGLKKLEQSL